VLVLLRELSSVNGSHVFACFVDMTAAIDNVYCLCLCLLANIPGEPRSASVYPSKGWWR